MEVSQDNIKIAKFVAGSIGFEPHVYPYWDDSKEKSIDILSLVDPINKNVRFYSSIGVSDYPNKIEIKNDEVINIPIEILISGYSKFDKIANILSTCCFYIIKDKWSCQPNDVYKNIIDLYYPKKEMKHIMFNAPFLWEDKLVPLKLDSKQVHFLFAIPISDNELEYKNKNGAKALIALFQSKNVDVFDIERNSVEFLT
ncbi:suppressor of fused domain protein [Flavobacterium sp. LS1R47]|uniref:Suppressor of fused domain protein n=1 Tax=Flavobacterium frigoritolerans TaxID=2987686 RepID=A0A9X3C9J6_9FLAO|nr:suppressor of fused domain protein [Flavobacterium frigoritolerans]MCV9934096.1 suppressor of fused domain protein [Flavobacterium frigoritolerans]